MFSLACICNSLIEARSNNLGRAQKGLQLTVLPAVKYASKQYTVTPSTLHLCHVVILLLFSIQVNIPEVGVQLEDRVHPKALRGVVSCGPTTCRPDACNTKSSFSGC